MRIAVDAMGGDHAPADVVLGALEASRSYGIPVCLVGREERIAPFLTQENIQGADFVVMAAPEEIGAHEKPAQAVRQKRLSSIVVGVESVRLGQADAFVSAGNTGALMTASLLGLGKMMRRPALGVVLPTLSGAPLLLLDAGASVDARPEDLVEYAVAGSLYAEQVLRRPRPSVALLNIGAEESKGNELVRAAYDLLKGQPLNFVGNIEGRDLIAGTVDVVVCDGFVGNIALKVIEGVGSGVFSLLREELAKGFQTRLGGLLVHERMRAVAKRLDYATYGGAPLFGVRGPVIKCHGSSRALAVRNGVRVAHDYVACGAVHSMEDALRREGEA
jgi:glycerol-3-phosphate acyltransferase PlsX